MLGPAFCFVVLDRAIEALKAGDNADKAKANLMENNKPFAYLGAVGPLLRDYTPLSREEFDDWRTTRSLQDKLESEGFQALTSDERDRLLRLHRRVVMIAYGELFHQVRKQWPLLARAYALLDELDSIAEAEDGDAMKAKRDEIEALAEELTGDGGDTEDGDTEETPFSFNKEAELIDELIALFRPFRQSEPDPEDVSAMGPEAAAGATWLMTQPALWRESELMRWLRSGEFARALLTQAGDDERLQAYAYGYMTHVAAAVTGQPFINVIAGGPYRSHWWRQRLVTNYVDTWVQGFYGASASMTGDEPHPPYEE